jgi:hypothetical protein
LLSIIRVFISKIAEAPQEIACTMDAKICPDGSSVGRSGPGCEFICPQTVENGKENLIKLNSVVPNQLIFSPLELTGEARGYWYFEASFPISLTNWDGLIIAEGIATAQGDWMTEDFVPFTANLNFTNPYNAGDQDIMKNGTLILRKDNPSALPENDDALEIPVRFAP